MNNQEFWVIGGEYVNMKFDRLIEGTQQMFGPFSSKSKAQRIWQETNSKYRSKGTARFSIVSAAPTLQ